MQPAKPEVEEAAASAPSPNRTPRAGLAVLRYTLLRLAIFLAAALLLWLVRVHGALLVVLALIISGLASYVLLSRERDAVAIHVSAGRQRMRERAAQRVAREDIAADDLQARADARNGGESA